VSNQSGTTYSHTGLTTGTTYGYYVVARNAAGVSSASGNSYGAPSSPITRRAVATAVDNTCSATTWTINKPTGTVQNDVMIAAITFGQNPTVTPPSGWTLIKRVDNLDASGYSSTAVYYKVAGASEPASYTWTLSVAGCMASWIASYYNVNTSTPIDVNNGQTNNSYSAPNYTFSTPSITTNYGSEMIVAAFGTFGGIYTWTPPTGMTEFADVNNTSSRAIEGAEVAQASAGASGTKTATCSTSSYGASVIFSLRQ